MKNLLTKITNRIKKFFQFAKSGNTWQIQIGGSGNKQSNSHQNDDLKHLLRQATKRQATKKDVDL